MLFQRNLVQERLSWPQGKQLGASRSLAWKATKQDRRKEGSGATADDGQRASSDAEDEITHQFKGQG